LCLVELCLVRLVVDLNVGERKQTEDHDKASRGSAELILRLRNRGGALQDFEENVGSEQTHAEQGGNDDE
jgi:hypothetical protein